MLTYEKSGVNIEKAEKLIDRLKGRIQSTFNPSVLNPIGGFASLTEIPRHYKDPIIVSSTDGVGTKLKIAFMLNKHDTVGIDLVAMSANDILTLGAKPYFFLDYYACGRIEDEVYTDVISGICEGCRQAGCALIGGETAEMPSFYKEKEYDLAGFIIGFVDRDKIIDGKNIRDGDVVIGLPSNGLHSNGFSLVRKVFFEDNSYSVFDTVEGLKKVLGEELLRPTKIYVNIIHDLLSRFKIKGMAHITGGGLPGNIKRIIPDGLSAFLEIEENFIQDIFRVIMNLGNVDFKEMCSTFNMGIGYVMVVEEEDFPSIMDFIREKGEEAFLLGSIKKRDSGDKVSVSLKP
ncbi:MAG: phosphoribosylformylglycinamidine cyclo-ligase [Syntrophorhabdaceae bacterium]|nr:phosphoribosylformylglycinamidine cyclo-ligase [Syntrophorhabdaceae bacterium]